MNEQEFSTVQSYVQSSLDWHYDQGLRIEVSCDFQKFYDAIRSLDGGYREEINPAFDYHYNRLDWSNALWLQAIDKTGTVMGQVAAKVVAPEPSLYDAYQTERFWFANRRPSTPAGVEMLSDSTRQIKGIITTGGCVWVHQSRRKSGLSGRITVLARALMIKEHRSDFHTGMVKQKLFEKNMLTTYQQRHSDLSLTLGMFGYPMHTIWSSRAESLELFTGQSIVMPERAYEYA
jgi:hypothetical protein